MGVDELVVYKMGVDEMGSRRSGMTPFTGQLKPVGSGLAPVTCCTYHVLLAGGWVFFLGISHFNPTL